MTTHSSVLAWEILWTEKPGGLQSTGLQRVRHDLVTELTPAVIPIHSTVSQSQAFQSLVTTLCFGGKKTHEKDPKLQTPWKITVIIHEN